MKNQRAVSAERLLQRIVEHSINAVKPSTPFEHKFHLTADKLNAFGYSIDLGNYREVKCVAIGKSAEAMAFEVKKKLDGRVNGIIATPVERHFDIEDFKFFHTGHPFPNEESVKAGKAVRDFVAGSDEKDLLLFLISGGGSASIFLPPEGVSLDDIKQMTKALLDNGVSIWKINLIRRHLSVLGGGKLSALAPKQKKISLIISDVAGDDVVSIASGPTVRDNTTPNDAYRLLEESGLKDKVPKSILPFLEKAGKDFAIPRFENNVVRMIASNADALSAAEKIGIENGFNTLVLTRFFEMDAENAADFLVSIARSIELEGNPIPAPALILLGGETTVRVKGNGKGGRNQHLVLTALRKLAALSRNNSVVTRTSVFSFGTDGKDGNSDDAGAFASFNTFEKVDGGLEEIERHISSNDSNTFFKKYGGLITTGPTGTNVMDILGIIVA